MGLKNFFINLWRVEGTEAGSQERAGTVFSSASLGGFGGGGEGEG